MHVQARAGQVARPQGVAEVGFHDQAAASGIDQVRAALHLGQEVAIDHAAGRFGQGNVQADDVRARQKLVERHSLDSVPLVEVGVEDRIERDDPHLKRRCSQRDGTADPAHADQAQRHAAHRRDQRPVPAAAVNDAIVVDDPPRHRQKQGPGLLGDAVLVGARA